MVCLSLMTKWLHDFLFGGTSRLRLFCPSPPSIFCGTVIFSQTDEAALRCCLLQLVLPSDQTHCCWLQISLRYTLDSLFAGEDAPFQLSRHMAETIGITVSTLLVALVFPAYAEKIFAITGATAVCIVCYVIPVGLHLKLQWLESSRLPLQDLIEHEEQEVQALLLPDDPQDAADVPVNVPLLQPEDPRSQNLPSALQKCWRTTQQIVLPVLVVVVGVFFSVAALFTTCRQWFV